MEVIPSVNVSDLETAKKNIAGARAFLPEGGWLHLDVGDGVFTPNITWGNPRELQELRVKNPELGNLNFEVHLMIEEPDAAVLPWLEAGAKRIIVHVESIEDVDYLQEICGNFKAQLGLAIAPETAVEELNVYFNKVHFYQVLAVDPGLAGQAFKKEVLGKIKFLRKEASDAILEVDGGVTKETAFLVRKAGANIVVSASYIFRSEDPAKAYQELKKI